MLRIYSTENEFLLIVQKIATVAGLMVYLKKYIVYYCLQFVCQIDLQQHDWFKLIGSKINKHPAHQDMTLSADLWEYIALVASRGNIYITYLYPSDL